jgi:hypothetical protein
MLSQRTIISYNLIRFGNSWPTNDRKSISIKSSNINHINHKNNEIIVQPFLDDVFCHGIEFGAFVKISCKYSLLLEVVVVVHSGRRRVGVWPLCLAVIFI